MPARGGVEIFITPNPTIVAREYFAAAVRSDDLATPMREVIGLWGSEIDTNFQAGGRPEPWKPLADATRAKRRADHMRDARAALRANPLQYESVNIGGTVLKRPIETEASSLALANFFQRESTIESSMTPLVRTGELSDQAGDESNWTVSGGNPAVAQMQDPTGYGLYHLTGGPFLPVRDWGFISDEALDEAGEYLVDYINEPLR